MSATTTITYNNVTIRDVLTHSIDQTPVYNRTQRDWQFTKTTITCSGIIWNSASGTPSGGIGFYTNQGNLSSTIKFLLEKLQVPKREFKYNIGGSDLYVVDGIKDADNGPKVTARLSHVISAHSAKVEFTITFNVPCNDTQVGSGIVAFRFWQADQIGDDWLTTRVTRGFLRVRRTSSAAGPVISVHELRNVVLPPLAPGFVRTSMNFEESMNGLELNFTIVDRETHAVPPWPAVKWSGTHTVAFPNAGAAWAESSISVRLEGPRGLDKRKLLWRAYQIMNFKLHLEDLLVDNQNFLLYAAFRDELNSGVVTGEAKVKHLDNTMLLGANATFLTPIDNLGNYDANRFLHPIPTASMASIFKQAVEFDLCNPANNLDDFTRPTENGGSFQKEAEGIDVTHSYTNTGGDFEQDNDVDEWKTKDPPAGGHGNKSGSTMGYGYYSIETQSDNELGTTRLPIAISPFIGPDSTPPSVKIQTHAPYTTKNVWIEAERLNKPPELPNEEEFTDQNGTVVTPELYKLSQSSPQISADGRKLLYHSKLHLCYRQEYSREPGQSIPSGHAPYIDSQNPRFVKGTTKDLINAINAKFNVVA